MVRSCIAVVAAPGRQTDGDGPASDAQASIDAFFDGDSSIFALERCPAADEECPESGERSSIPLAPAA